MSKRSQFLVDISKLILYADSIGVRLICTDFDRSQAEQERLVLIGRSWTRNSRHLIWQAMDFSIVEPDGSINWDNDLTSQYTEYEKLGQFWESLDSNHIWGAGKNINGTRKDVYHFEIKE